VPDFEVPPDKIDGVYSNVAMIRFSPFEFIMDFARISPGRQKPVVVGRVIMSPEHAKSFLNALQENIKKFDSMPKELTPPIGFKPS
jgi:hypothetical protein